MQIYFKIAMQTGCRRGEIGGLKWKDFNYVDIDYFKNETFEISGTIEEDYGVGALTLQLEFVGSKVNDGLFDDSEDNSIAYEYRIFRKYGEYYYNNGKYPL